MKAACAILIVLVVCFAFGACGCSKQQPAMPASAAPNEPATTKVEPKPAPSADTVEESGTVKVEFDIADPRSIITISGNDYSPKELEQPIALKPGAHTMIVKQPGRKLAPQNFTVEKGRRRIVRVYDPERKAAEWVFGIPGQLWIWVDGKEVEVKNLTDLPQTELSIAGIGLGKSKITDSDLEQLVGLTRLKRLFLQDTTVTDGGLAHLRGLTELQDVDLSRTKITDAGLEHLKGLPKLGHLRLTGIPITDSGVAQLKDCHLVLLYLTDSKVTDSGVADLKGRTGMAYLHLENTAVTDACLVHLKGLKQLEYLGLNGTKVTDAGVVEIKAALPSCNVKR